MATQRRFFVSPDGDRWRVQESGKEAIADFANKEDAILRATELAKSSQPAQVLVQKRDGRIEQERTYRFDPRKLTG